MGGHPFPRRKIYMHFLYVWSNSAFIFRAVLQSSVVFAEAAESQFFACPLARHVGPRGSSDFKHGPHLFPLLSLLSCQMVRWRLGTHSCERTCSGQSLHRRTLVFAQCNSCRSSANHPPVDETASRRVFLLSPAACSTARVMIWRISLIPIFSCLINSAP